VRPQAQKPGIARNRGFASFDFEVPSVRAQAVEGNHASRKQEFLAFFLVLAEDLKAEARQNGLGLCIVDPGFVFQTPGETARKFRALEGDPGA